MVKSWNSVRKEIDSKLKLEAKDKCFYVEFNYYNEPRWEIIKYEEINWGDMPGSNSNGYWGREESGVMKNWYDLSVYNSK